MPTLQVCTYRAPPQEPQATNIPSLARAHRQAWPTSSTAGLRLTQEPKTPQLSLLKSNVRRSDPPGKPSGVSFCAKMAPSTTEAGEENPEGVFRSPLPPVTLQEQLATARYSQSGADISRRCRCINKVILA